jgi:hypothetical protein
VYGFEKPLGFLKPYTDSVPGCLSAKASHLRNDEAAPWRPFCALNLWLNLWPLPQRSDEAVSDGGLVLNRSVAVTAQAHLVRVGLEGSCLLDAGLPAKLSQEFRLLTLGHLDVQVAASGRKLLL